MGEVWAVNLAPAKDVFRDFLVLWWPGDGLGQGPFCRRLT